MRQLTFAAAVLTLCLAPCAAPAGPSKENDLDINYDEDKAGKYELPPLLVTAEGGPVATPEEWRTVRRPQMPALFSKGIAPLFHHDGQNCPKAKERPTC